MSARKALILLRSLPDLLRRPRPLRFFQERRGEKEAIVNNSLMFLPLSAGLFLLSGCELAGDIFKAGVWVGVLLVLGVIGGVIWLVSRAGT